MRGTGKQHLSPSVLKRVTTRHKGATRGKKGMEAPGAGLTKQVGSPESKDSGQVSLFGVRGTQTEGPRGFHGCV